MVEKRIWELLTKKFNNEISEEELHELNELMSSQYEMTSYAEVISSLSSLKLKEGYEEEQRKDHSLSAIREAIRPSSGMEPEGTGIPGNPFNRRKLIFIAVAALVLFMAGGVYSLLHQSMNTPSDVASFNMIVTKAGSKTFITLPDSSAVVLNGACRFGYNKEFGVRKREMVLTGEAYFDIHKNPDMPLIVAAGNVNISVLGTSFNVKAYAEDSFVEATLIRGVIEVSLKTDPERAILLRPNEKIVIRKNDGIPVAPSGKGVPAEHKSMGEEIAVSKVEMDPTDSTYVETAWLKDKMVFRKEYFGSLARRMERWYNVKVVFAEPALNNLVFTGSFEKEDLREALQALRNSSNFNYSIEGDTVTITKNNR